MSDGDFQTYEEPRTNILDTIALMNDIVIAVDEYPNDADLGKEVRKLVTNQSIINKIEQTGETENI